MLSYSFDGKVIHDRGAFEWKLRRTGYAPDDTFLIVSWSKRRETIHLSEHITIESLPAVVGHRRYIYDIAFPFVVLLMPAVRRFAPLRISIADFPLVWGAYVAKIVTGARIELHIGRLPRDLARTRSRFHVLYEYVHERLGYRFPDVYVAINEATKTYVRGLGVPEERIRLKPPDTISADSQFIREAKPGRVRTRLGISSDSPIIFSVGRLEPEKAFDELIRNFAAVRSDAHLIIAGEGRLAESLREISLNLGVEARVHFVGSVSRKDLWDFFADANVFALLSRSEGLGLVVWEAMYAGVPVIGRPIGGIRESVGADGERGLHWDTADGAESFAIAVKKCVDREGTIQVMCERAKKYVEGILCLV